MDVIIPTLDALWYKKHPLSLCLAPLGWLFCLAVAVRRFAYRFGLRTVTGFPIPIIVVGNITVGGTGKTPLVVWLAKFLTAQGYRPGIVCRGYRGKALHWPQQVRSDADPRTVGDEAVVLARRAGCPVAADPKRVAAVQALISYAHCNVVISDDGMQHLALGRQIEIAVIDGIRRNGNGRCLPAGPLREPVARLQEVDLIVTNGLAGRGEYPMTLISGPARNVCDERQERALDRFRKTPVHAVAGLGHPERFFEELRRSGIHVVPHAFADHHEYRPDDIAFNDRLPVMMTEKDAVKCRSFAEPRHWYVPVKAEPHSLFGERVLRLLEGSKPHG
ncbi:MAG: tetraacyldisaccharide 4'-kinase [Gammaproteobacteria bacterium]